MKGHFSIEWLSQSSQALCSSASTHPSNSWDSPGRDGPSTSGTASESLPGFYSRWRPENTEGREKRMEPAQPGNSLCTSGAPKEAAPSASPSTGRRPRTAFTAEQINSLEKAFKRNAYLGAQDKAELCKRLNLCYGSLHQIRNWFQNRRMKLKRTVQDSLAHACQAKVASHMMHYSDLHGFRAAPYPSFYPGVQESPAPYGSGFHYGPATAGSLSSLPVDALYQYSTLQSLPVHPSNPSMMYPPYHSHYYSTQ